MTAAQRMSLSDGGRMNAAEESQLLTPGEVAALFRVNAKTVTRWAQAGKISTVRTLGGHRRFRRDEVEACLHAGQAVEAPSRS
jgi:excisionase family DNA binding protein